MTEQRKLRVLILFGGKSGEHEVSVVSATHVVRALDPAKYTVQAVGITQAGQWIALSDGEPLSALDDPRRQLTPALLQDSSGQLSLSTGSHSSIDVVIPVLHGPNGEDGTVQGLLELAGIPYVGGGVLASALAMDKWVAKQLFTSAGLPVVPAIMIFSSKIRNDIGAVIQELETAFVYPLFVKPANMGSSVGISKAKNSDELKAALLQASQYDRKVIVETAVPSAREIEIGVLGNEIIELSVAGEIVPDREFYDFESKYSDESTSQEIIPAKLTSEQEASIRSIATAAYKLLDAAGMARVDFLVNDLTGEVFLNEVNTIPGFTPHSMFPKLWAASGTSYAQLVDRLIVLALERAEEKQKVRTRRS